MFYATVDQTLEWRSEAIACYQGQGPVNFRFTEHKKARCGGPSGLLAALEEPLPPADEVAGDVDETAHPKRSGNQTKANDASVDPVPELLDVQTTGALRRSERAI